MKNLESSTTHFLIIASGAYHFALPAHCVQKILPALPVTPIPFVPACIDGLVNVDGAIAIQINLATLSASTHTGRTELILFKVEHILYALQAERIIERTFLTPQPIQTSDTPVDKTLLTAEAPYKNNTVYILDPQRIGTLIQTSSLQVSNTGTLGKILDNDNTEDNTTIACLAVGIGKDEYAFELQSVIEILEADTNTYTAIPNAPAGLLGFFLLRQQAIPVIELACLVGSDAATTKNSWLIVIEREDILYGLLVHHLIGVKKFPFDSFQPVVDSNQHISGLFIHEKNTTLLLSARQIIHEELAQFLAPYVLQNNIFSDKQKEETGSFLKVILCEKPFIIPLHNVRRIVPFFPMNHLNEDKESICGAISIDGEVIPVLSIEKILKIDQKNTHNEYVIVGDTSQEWAICVEAAQHIIKIPLANIHSEDTLDARPLSGLAHVAEELIPLLNPNMFRQQPSTLV